MRVFTEKRREAIAKNLDDMAKTIFAVGLAGGFFKDFHLRVRVLMAVVCAALFVVGFYLQPKGEKP